MVPKFFEFTGPEQIVVGACVILRSEAAALAYNPFSTSVVTKIRKDGLGGAALRYTLSRPHGAVSEHGTFYTATEVYDTVLGFTRFCENFVGYTTGASGKLMVARA
jgi:hypothetical protein